MKNRFHIAIVYLAAAVWLINGLLCKILNMVPRHREIVGELLGHYYAGTFTFVIGLLECLMAFWILSGFWPRVNTLTQIVVILSMNLIEFALVPGLLLWGRINLVWALLFSMLLAWNGFVFKPKKIRT